MIKKGMYYTGRSTGNAKKMHQVQQSSTFYMTCNKNQYDELLQWCATLINKGVN